MVQAAIRSQHCDRGEGEVERGRERKRERNDANQRGYSWIMKYTQDLGIHNREGEGKVKADIPPSKERFSCER